MRTLSISFRTAHEAEHDGSVVDIALLTISHPLLETDIHISSDPTQRLQVDPELVYGTNSRDKTYVFIGPIDWVLPEDGAEAPPSIPLRIPNFDHRTVELLRSTDEPASVLVEIVSSEDPDHVEIEFPLYDLPLVTVDESVIDVSLTLDSLMGERVPAGTFGPEEFGGLF